MEVIRFKHDDKTNMAEALALRTAVFVQEQGIAPELEYDDYDHVATHYLCRIGDRIAGTGRWRETAQGFKLERYAVLAGFRNHGVGAAILHRMLEDLLPLGKTIYLRAQITAVAFYEKHGFVCEGPIFYEAGIGHYKMIFPR